MRRFSATLAKTVPFAVLSVVLIVVVVGHGQTIGSPDHIGETVLVPLLSGEALTVQTREVTLVQWQACNHAGKCTLDISLGDSTPDYPATGLSYLDAMEYVGWVNLQDGRRWRLPTVEEWNEIAVDVIEAAPDPIFSDPSLTWASAYLMREDRTGRALHPSGSFSVTKSGIEDLDGNVWEWTQSCYAGASNQGERIDIARCPAFKMGGAHEAVVPFLVRDPARGGCAVGAPPAHLGMRLVSDQL